MEAFLYFDSMQPDVHDKREVLLGDADPWHLSDGKDGAGDNMSANSITGEMTGEGDGNSTINLLSDYSIYVPIEKELDSLSA